jgi:autotransporter-associated beta strand protein
VVRAPSNDITYQVSAGTLIFEDFDSASGSETITVTGGSLGTWGLRTIGNDVVFSNPGGRLVSQSNIGRWTGAITLNGNTTFDAMGTLVIDGALAGIGNITRSGGGTLVLQNTSAAFSGKITNPSGALRILEPGVLGSATGADVLTLGDGTTLQGGNAFSIGSATIGSPTQGITQTGNVTYDAGHGALLVVDSPITGTGNINKPNNSGTIRFNSSVSTTGNLNANGGGVTVTNSLNITDATNGTVLSENLNTLTFASGANANIRNLSLRTSVMNIQPGASVTTNRFVTSDGSAARSVINQTGGTFNITGSDNSNTTGRSFLLGHWGSGGTTSVYNLSGGTINSTAASMGFGWDSADVAFNQSGGTFNVLGLALDNGRNNLARFNLTGGRLNLGAAGISNASNKQVNLGGGTVGAFADWNALKPLTLTGIGGDTVFDTLDSVDGTTPRTINLTAALHGPGGFVKTGAGTLIANHPDNLIAGTARIEDGTLQLRTSAASSGDVELAGGHLQLTGAIAADHVDLGGGSVTFNVGETTSTITCNTLEVSQPTTVQLAPQGLLTLNDEFTIIDYTGTIDGLGLGGLTLTPLPSPRISLSLNEDAVNSRLIVRVDATDSLIWTGAQNMVWDGSTLNWRQASDSAPASFATFDTVRFDGASPGTVSLTGSHNAALVEVDSSSNYVFAGTGQLSGSTMVRKSGSGTLTILNANAHTGGNTIIDGTLRLGNANAAGASGAVIDVQSGGTLDLNGQDLEGANTLVTSNGIIANNSPTVAALRRLELTGDTTMNVANPIVVGAFSGADGTLNLNGHTLVKNGAGQLTVNGVSIGDGNIVVNQGVLRLIRDYNDNQRAVSITGSGSITINAGATMVTDRWAVGLTLTKPITLNGGTIGSDWPGPNGSTIASPITVAADSTMNFTGGYANVTFSGVITGPGKITRIGSETVNFTAVNSYEGGTQLTSGNLAFEAGSLGTTGDITMDGGTLVWRPGNSEDISSRVAMVFAKNANFNTGANNVTFASGIGNDANAALVKTGTGSLTLQGANSYTGNTTVNNGTFRLEAGGSMEVVLGFSGNNNRITATTTLDNDENVTASGNVQLAGTLVLDFTTADIFDGNAWVLAEAFGSAAAVNYEGTFSLNSTAGSFTRAGSVHTLVDGDNTWTFDEATGTLTLGVSSGTGYDDWALQIADVNQRGRDDDPDGDGFTNLQEFLFGTSPNEPNGSLSSAQRDGNNLIVRWLELESGATYTLLESATLDNPWITSAVVPFDDAFQTGVPAGYIRRVAEVPIGSGRNFVRIEGEEN